MALFTNMFIVEALGCQFCLHHSDPKKILKISCVLMHCSFDLVAESNPVYFIVCFRSSPHHFSVMYNT